MIKNLKCTIVLVIAVTLAFGMTACNGNVSANGEAVVEESAAPPQAATVEEALPEVDTNSDVNVLIGSWKGVSDTTLYANITKTDTAYQYEDNDGKYTATFENGKLKVPVSDDAADFAEVYVDADTGHLYVLYQGGLSEFEKK